MARVLHNKVFLPKVDELTWQGTRDDYAEKAKTVGVLREQNEDLRSLKELLVYGLKGMAAYLEHAMPVSYTHLPLRTDHLGTHTAVAQYE